MKPLVSELENHGPMASKSCPHVLGLSEALAARDVPLSPVVRYGNLVFVSGIPPLNLATGKIDPNPVEVQTEIAIGNVRLCLQSAGSDLDKVLKATILISNSAYYEIVNGVYRKHFRSNFPARTFCTVGSWPWPFDIEIECVAHV